jgi:hypothetical protein
VHQLVIQRHWSPRANGSAGSLQSLRLQPQLPVQGTDHSAFIIHCNPIITISATSFESPGVSH